jgi:hypothetical protein
MCILRRIRLLPATDSFTISLLRGCFDGLRSAVVRGPVVAVPTVTVAAGPIRFVIKLVAGDGWQHVAENVVELPAGDRRSGWIALAGGWGVVIRTDPRRLVTWYR